MRRTVLALAIAAGLAIGTVVPASALGDTNITLTCSDGTSLTTVVDAATLTGLTQAVQAMLDYPAGLSCTLLQTPVVLPFGLIAVAASEPFVVGGGRYQLSCDAKGLPGGKPIETRRDTTAPMVASSNPMKLTAASSYQPLQTGDTYWVNIAINDHQKDGSYVGTLNETIPDGQCADHGHFTSKPTCLFISGNTAYVTSVVTQTSGGTTGNFFPPLSGPVQDGSSPSFLRFSFEDNGNGSSLTNDNLNGILLTFDPGCTQSNIGFVAPLVPLLNGNITVH